MSKKIQIAVIQMDIDAGNVKANFSKAVSMLEQSVNSDIKPDVIVLPEMWNTGYALDQIESIADEEGNETKALLSNFAKKHGVNIIGGSVAERKGDKVYNTTYTFDREGKCIGQYSKIHLFRLMEEEKYLTAGDTPGTLEIDGEPAASLICYDIRFPELTRLLALGGAKLLFVPAEWPHPRLHHWKTLLTARAIENQMFVIACNRMGTSGTSEFFGHSMVLNPWGETVAEAGEEETVLRAEIDLSLVDSVRATIPVFEDRRPPLYKL